MSVKGRLDRLEKRVKPARRVTFVFLDCPPDGRTRLMYSDGTEAAPGEPFEEDEQTQTLVGLDPDLIVGAKVFRGLDPDEI